MTELKVEGLEHRFNGRRALHRMDFALTAPGALAVTGANGSGKTTLLRVLAGLLRAESGTHRLWVEGREVPYRRRREAAGLVSADLSLYDELTARENLEFFAAARGLPDPAEAARRGLHQVGLEARADDRVRDYSSGMKQRLKLAFALQHQPALLLLDEPGSHLDDEGRERVAALCAEQARRALLVIATNDEREVPPNAKTIRLRGSGLGHPGEGVEG